ncbi:MAG: DUF503 domain-containing protein [Calditerrivibrio sp.]|nr:DUF503 domain-containing protein [Calditerrivibrio sp.]
MVIGTLLLEMDIPAARSLKDKRSVVSSFKAKLRSKFNVSVAEVGDKEIWNRAYIAVAIVGENAGFIDSQLQEVIKFTEYLKDAVIVDIKQEII